MHFKLRFPLHDVPDWAARFGYSAGEELPLKLGAAARRRGCLTKPEFLALARWKSPRTGPRCAENSAGFIRAVTGAALSSNDERLRVEVLTLLSGVHWPTASVILHFCASDAYPILDYRALWSLSSGVPANGYHFDFWWAYCEFTRDLAARADVSMRVLDRALWQYSKERGP